LEQSAHRAQYGTMKLIEILDATPIPVTYRLAFLTNFLREPILRRMERETGLIRPELTVLMCVSFQPDVNARDICEITEQPSNTVSRAVTSLVDKRYVKSERDEIDTRRRVLNITAKGQKALDGVMDMFATTEATLLEKLSASEVQTLTMLLDKLSRDVARWRPQ